MGAGLAAIRRGFGVPGPPSVTNTDARAQAAGDDGSVRIGAVIVVVLGIALAFVPRADAALGNGPIVFWVQMDCGIDGCEDILSDGIFAADPRTGATHEVVAGGYDFAFSAGGWPTSTARRCGSPAPTAPTPR